MTTFRNKLFTPKGALIYFTVCYVVIGITYATWHYGAFS